MRPTRRLCLAAASLTVTGTALAGLAHASATRPAVRAGAVPSPIRVGTNGNEPLIAVAPNGTLYISALQYVYRSVDHGAHWTIMPAPLEASTLELASDSSISVDPGGRLYFSFDYPYAGATAVCTTDTGGQAWACDPKTVPGGTDRMWIAAPSTAAQFVTTNQGAYEPVFLVSNDRGATWVPHSLAASGLNPYTGQPVQASNGGTVVQPVGTGPVQNDNAVDLHVNRYDLSATGLVSSEVPTGLPAPYALPSAAVDRGGVMYVTSEKVTAAGGRGVVVARSTDQGATWSTLPALPGSTKGTATFTAIAAGPSGHVGVLYYYSKDAGDPGKLTKTSWQAVWASSSDASSAHPHWKLTTVDPDLGHRGAICRGLNCEMDTSTTPPTSTDARYAGDCLGAAIDSKGNAYLTWMGETGKRPEVRFSRVAAR